MYSADPKKIMRPWTPVEAVEEENVCRINVWGRQYTVAGNILPSSMISSDKEMLAAPMRVAAGENGKDVVFSEAKCYLMDEVTPEAAGFCCASEVGEFLVDTTCKVEYDGFMDWTLSVMPKGLSVAAACGVAEDEEITCTLDRLWLEIPLRSEHFPYYSFYPVGNFRVDGKECISDSFHSFNYAGLIKEHMEFPFSVQFHVSGDEIGLAVFCESEENWDYDGYPFELIKKGEETLLRIHFLDHEPKNWRNVTGEDRAHMKPVTFRFHMITTPVKPMSKNPYEEHSLHIDCGHKVLSDYEDYLFGKFVDTGEVTGIPPEGTAVKYDEITFDRIERMGVKILYLHEKWNTLQNSPYITRQSANRLKKIVKEAHKRGIRVIPYFGYEISTLAPFWGEYGLQFGLKAVGDESPIWSWYRQPPQRDLRVCYGDRTLRQLFVEGIRKLVETFGFDGIYLDGTVYPVGCKNERHGCGWRDEEGKMHPTYPVNDIRELMKELYAIMDPMGCIINCHAGMVYNLAAISFYHSIWDGETIQIPLLNGLVHELPDEYMRAKLNYRSMGLPFYMLCYANAPKWTFRRGLSLALLYGVIPKPNNAGAPLEDMEQIWKILDAIPIERAQWKPFYKNQEEVEVSDDAVKVSFYEYSDIAGRKCRLIFCSNTHDTPSDAVIRFREKPSGMLNLFGREVKETADGFTISYENFDCSIFYTET